MAKNLKVLDLSWCSKLVRTPNFSSHLQLERLILVGCSALVEIDESIVMLKLLVLLDLSFCDGLHKLPKELGCMESLTELLLNNCKGIVEIPQLSNMVKLEVFDADSCSSLKCCISLNNLTSLKKLSLGNPQISLVPDTIGELVHLVELNLVRCYSLKKLPESIGGLVSLTHLNLCGSGIEELPKFIGGLVSLTHLDISKCDIEELPNSISCLKNLIQLRMRHTPIRELPSTIGMAKKLKEIDAEGCRLLCGGLPLLPESLINLTLPSEIMDEVLNLSNLINLVNFDLDVNEWALIDWASRDWTLMECPSPVWIGNLSKAERLDLAFPWFTTLHPDVGSLSQLIRLGLIGCVRLQSIPKLPLKLTSLRFDHCCMISKVDELPENLIELEISNCGNLRSLPQMSQYKKLEFLFLRGCPNLVEIHGRLESLRRLCIKYCESLLKIPDILNVKTLEYLNIEDCPKLFHGSDIRHYGPILPDSPPK